MEMSTVSLSSMEMLLQTSSWPSGKHVHLIRSIDFMIKHYPQHRYMSLHQGLKSVQLFQNQLPKENSSSN